MSEKDEGENGSRVLVGPHVDGDDSSDAPSSQSNGILHPESSAVTDAGAYQGANMEDGDSSGEEATKVADDTGKDDMFLDASDEINDDARDAVVITERDGASVESNNLQDGKAFQLENGPQDHYLMDELLHMRALLEKTVNEKELASRQHKEERDIYAKEIGDLHHQLKSLTCKKPLLHENGDMMVDYNHRAEYEDGDERTDAPEVSTRDAISECRDFVRGVLEEQLWMQGIIRELHETVSTKDQLIEDLKSKIAENTVSHGVEDAASRILDSLALVGGHQDLLDGSTAEKMNHVERRTMHLIEKYNQIVSQIDHLKQVLSDATLESLDYSTQDGLGDILTASCNELFEYKRKEVYFAEQIRYLEDENRKLIEQLSRDRELTEVTNAELDRLKGEIEQEKVRYANVKEKLSMAVTKGKSLVQQRDALKHSLADKTSELDRCLSALQEKSSALEAAEQSKEELAQSEKLVALLQENLSQRNGILVRFEEMLCEANLPEEMQSVDIVDKCRWLVDERDMLKGAFREFQNLRDSLVEIEVPEFVAMSNLESRVSWLKDSLSRANSEVEILRAEISSIKQAAHDEINRLSAAFSVLSLEKEHLQMEMDDFMFEYEEIVKKVQQVSLLKEQMIALLLKGSGVSVSEELGLYQNSSSSECALLIERCFEKVKEQSTSIEGPSHADLESFERIQTLLYVRDLELVLYEKVYEEEMVEKSQEIINISSELKLLSSGLEALKEDKVHLQKDLERSEEKSSLLREKLSMAVKKGKGLVQDRENLKHLLEEKNSEIEKLKLQIEQQESTVSESRDQISKLEADLVAMKVERDQLEQFLLESNNMLEKVIESIDGISLPTDSAFVEPVEKVKWLVVYLTDCQKAKELAEEQLAKVQEESSDLVGRVAEAQASLKLLQGEMQQFEKMKEEVTDLHSKLVEAKTSNQTLEDALSTVQNDLLRLAEEKRDVEVAKENVEKELQQAIEESSLHASKFTEAFDLKKSLEKALSQAENVIHVLNKEKEVAQACKVAAESDLEKVKEEISIQTGKLTDAYQTIRSLEDASSQLEERVALLTEQNHNLEVEKTNFENELKNLRDEAATKEMKLADASVTVKSLEEALLKAETRIAEIAAESDLEKVKEDISIQTGKLTDAYQTIKSLEDSSSQLEETVALLTEQNHNLEVEKTNFENELKNLRDEAATKEMKLADAFVTIKSLEDALLKAESRIVEVAAESSLEKVKEEISIQTGKLTDAYRTIKSLKDASSQLEERVAFLSEQNHNLEVEKTNFENELKKLQDEVATNETKLADASVSIKSLEDAVLKAQSRIAELENQSKTYNQEIEGLNLKLNVCLEDLSGKSSNLESRSLELVGHLNELQDVVNDESLFSLMKNSFEKKFESLKCMNAILEEVKDQHIAIPSEAAEKQSANQEDPLSGYHFASDLCNRLSFEFEMGVTKEVGEDVSSLFRKTIEGFRLKSKTLADKFENLSTFMDEILVTLLRKLEGTSDDVKAMSQCMKRLLKNVEDMEMYKQEHGEAMSMLEDSFATLLSACNDATRKLLLEVEKSPLRQFSEPETLSRSTSEGKESSRIDTKSYQKKVDGSNYTKTVEDLLFAVEKVQSLINQLQSTNEVADLKIKNLENELRKVIVVSKEAVEERDLKTNRISELETEVETLQGMCSELRLKVKEFQVDYHKLKEREAELLEVKNNLLVKQQENSFMSPSEATALLKTVNGIEIPSEDLPGDTKPHSSPHVQKLLYIIDGFTRAQHQISLLSHDNEELQSNLFEKGLENKHLKEEVGKHIRYKEDSDKMKDDLSKLRVSLEKIFSMLGGSQFPENQAPSGLEGLLTLETQITNLLSECTNSKSEAQQLGIKLLESQKTVDELSTKVKLLEERLQGRSTQPEIVQERSIFEPPSLPTGSTEISEVEDAGSGGKNLMTAIPSAAHVRTMKKGSTEHLALSIDVESNPLVSNQDTNEEKGHVFKSLNTSGLIPKQGKLIADRMDSIWVSGGRILMSRPRARLGFIAYCFFLHMWVLATIL